MIIPIVTPVGGGGSLLEILGGLSISIILTYYIMLPIGFYIDMYDVDTKKEFKLMFIPLYLWIKGAVEGIRNVIEDYKELD